MLSFAILALAAVASANVIHQDKCPLDLLAVKNFNLTAYQGTWYDISKYPHDGEKNGKHGKCDSSEFKMEGEVMKVKDVHVSNGVQTVMEGSAKVAPDADKSGKLILSYKIGDVSKDFTRTILATDYTNYAIVYDCEDNVNNKTHQDFLWILSRSKKLEGGAKTAVDNFFKAHSKELDASKLVLTDFSEEACKFNSTEVAKKH